jgi:hypothetical protein
MRYRQKIKIIAVVVCLSFILQTAAFANPFKRDAHIANMTAINNQGDLSLSFKVDGAFKENLEETILSGALTTFSYIIIVSESRGVLPDKTILQINLTHTIKYNNLKNDFTVQRSWEDNKPQTTESFEEAKQWMSEIKDLKLMPLSHIQKGANYKIKAKAELDKVRLPLFLNYIFFFVSLLDFETSWKTINFFY